MAGAVARSKPAAQSQGPRDSLALGQLRLAKACQAFVGWITQHGPDRGAFPAREAFACRYTLLIEPTHDCGDAQPLGGVPVIDLAHHGSLFFDDFVVRARLLGFSHVAISVRGATQHIHVAQTRMMAFPAPRALQDLRTLVFGDHALELHQQLIFRAMPLRRFDEGCFHAVAAELFEEQHLIGVLAAQTIRRIHQHRLQLSLRGKITDLLKPRTQQICAAKPFVFENPFPRHVIAVFLSKCDQRRCLTRYRVLLLLLGGGDSGVNRGVLHGGPLSTLRLRPLPARGRERGSHRLVGAWR